MNIKETIREKAMETYSESDYVKERVEKELDHFEKDERFGEIESILKIKEIVDDQNVYVFPTGMLSLYLLDLDFINPMPAHYYDVQKKQILFDSSALYGVDLPEKDGLERDGFSISEEYSFNLKKPTHFELYLYEKYIDDIKELLKDSFDIEIKAEEAERDGHKEKITYGSTTIIFNDSYVDDFFGKNLCRDIDSVDFSKYLFEGSAKDLLEGELKSEKPKTFGELMELLALSKLSTREGVNKLTQFKDLKFPKTREDIFEYLRDEGYSAEDAAEITRQISIGKDPDVKITDESIKEYFEQLQYVWAKGSVVSIFLRDYHAKRCFRMQKISIWRLQTKTDNEIKDYSVSDYCIDNGLLALGWSLRDSHLGEKARSREVVKSRSLISEGNEEENYNKYERFVKENDVYKSYSTITRLKNDIKPYDLVWMRKDGIYWLGIVGENSKYRYNSSEQALNMDASNQRTDIKWFEIGGEADVPGAVTTCFIQGHTLQRIKQEGVLEFSTYLINTMSGEAIYEAKKMKKSPESLFNLLSSNDCEDILCMWLSKKYGYIAVPSTCKRSTQLYECVLLNPSADENKEVYVQVKKGHDNLKYSDYQHLDGEVWLFTTRGQVIGEKQESINAVDPEEIYDFVMSGKNDNYLPSKILKWRELLKLN
nr:hypothetical protein [uncultured Peptoniphilus sp.]